MNIVFRVDASALIGSGHVMRCLTLAEALRNQGHQISFICRQLPGNLNATIREKFFEVNELKYDHVFDLAPVDLYTSFLGEKMHVELKLSIEIFSEIMPDIIIVDHYALDILWESCARPFCKRIVVIDDLANRKHDCDLLLDQNIQTKNNRYEQWVPNSCELLLGAEYALLRPEFLKWREQLAHKKYYSLKRIFVFLGGSDHDNVTKVILSGIEKSRFQGVVDVVLGESNTYLKTLKMELFHCASFQFHQSVENMAELMSIADLCIGAAGASSWERCCLGLPSFIVSIAQNQETIIEALLSQNAAYYLGNSEKISAQVISDALDLFVENPERLQGLSICSKKLVDGCGVDRVVEKIFLKSNENIFGTIELRTATIKDMRYIFDLRNHPDIRKYSFSTTPLEYTQHEKWFSDSLKNMNRIILIASEKSGKLIGVVRFDFFKDSGEVSIFIDPKLHGHGYGSVILMAGIKWLKKQGYCQKITAKVMTKNSVSHDFFLKNGFVKEYVSYLKEI